jgi:hypothetical protein
MGGWHGARRWGAPAVAAGLGVLELALVRLAGPAGRQLEVLRQLGEVEADPLASLLALLALAAEGLAAYLLARAGAAAAGVAAWRRRPAGRRRHRTHHTRHGPPRAGPTPRRRPAGTGDPHAPSRQRGRRSPADGRRSPADGRRSPARGRRPATGARRGGLVANRCGAVGGRAPLPPWLAVVGPDPDLIHRGTRLLVPPYRPDRR